MQNAAAMKHRFPRHTYAHSFSEEDVVALFVSLVFSRFLSLSLSSLSFSWYVFRVFDVTLNSRVVVEKSNPRQNIINALWQISRGCRERNETDRDEEQQFFDC